MTNPLGKPIKVSVGTQTEASYVSKKKLILDEIRQARLHNREDLILIVQTLQEKSDAFKVLCGCVALEHFLEEESRFENLNHHMKTGTVRIDPESSAVGKREMSPLSKTTDTKNATQPPQYLTIYQQTRSRYGSYRLNPKDAERLVEILLEVVTSKISLSDFYHDKAFYCIIKLLLKVHNMHQKNRYSKDFDAVKQRQQEWFLGIRDRLHTLMNVADLKLCEFYWQ